MTAAGPASARPLRFIAVGAANTLLTWLLFAALVTWLDHQPALLLTYAVGITLAWYGNSRIVFKSRPGPAQLAVYPLIYLGTWLVNASLLEWLVTAHAFGPRLAQALALVLVIPISYLLNASLLGGQRHRIGLALSTLPALVIGALVLSIQLNGSWYPGPASTGLILHLGCGLMIILLIRRLLGQVPDPAGGGPYGPPVVRPALFALLFLLNPLSSQALALDAGHAEQTATLLALFGLWAWIGLPTRQGGHDEWALPLLMLPAMALYPPLFVLPLALIILALAWPGRAGERRWLTLAASTVLAIAFVLMGGPGLCGLLPAALCESPLSLQAAGAFALAPTGMWLGGVLALGLGAMVLVERATAWIAGALLLLAILLGLAEVLGPSVSVLRHPGGGFHALPAWLLLAAGLLVGSLRRPALAVALGGLLLGSALLLALPPGPATDRNTDPAMANCMPLVPIPKLESLDATAFSSAPSFGVPPGHDPDRRLFLDS